MKRPEKKEMAQIFRDLAMGALIGMWLSSGNATAASGSCDDPDSLAKLPPSKRAMIEARCKDSAERKVREQSFHENKLAWATAYFADKPAMWEAYNDNAAQVVGCPGGFEDTSCGISELQTYFHKAAVSVDRIIWIDRGSSNGGASYTCERYEFSIDGADLLEYETYRC